MTEYGRGPILLARYLALAWLGLIVYGSLHPFSGWRDTGLPPLAWLDGGWPRYWTVFDLCANAAVYLPAGFFLTLALRRLPGRFTAPLLAVILCAALSASLETAQTWLPARVPSNLDLACNAIGGLFGAIWAQWAGPRLFIRIARLEQRLVAPIPHAELGLTLLGLWLLVPLSPETLLFGAGDCRHWFSFAEILPFSLPFAVHSFARIEAGITALNMLAVGLIVRQLSARLLAAWLIVPLFLLLGLVVRTLGAAILIGPGEAFAWFTPGAQQGLLTGGLLLAVAILLPARLRLMLTVLALLAGALLVNLAPANPYSLAALATWRQGHFLNFNGLTRLAATLWPLLALPFLFLTTRRAQAGRPL
ncbi:MAG: VanZ family protein [Azonexus sp.]|jgi:VanZ family protein|nr:VanZ family protein [Azonexus sp.]